MTDMRAKTLLYEARALEKEGKLEEAIQKYEEALSLDNQLAKAWFYKFRIHHGLGQKDDAEHCAQKAVDLDPKWMKFIRQEKDKKISKLERQTDQAVAPQPEKKRYHTFVPQEIIPILLMQGEMKSLTGKKKKKKKKKKLPREFVAQFEAIGFSEDFLNGLGSHASTEVEFEGNKIPISPLDSTHLGMATEDIEGIGPHEVRNTATGEVWTIERVGLKIVIHSHTEPPQFPDPRIEDVPFWYRLLLALAGLGKIDIKEIAGGFYQR